EYHSPKPGRIVVRQVPPLSDLTASCRPELRARRWSLARRPAPARGVRRPRPWCYAWGSRRRRGWTRLRAVFPTSVKVTPVPVVSGPADHFIATPYGDVGFSRRGCISSACSHPAVGAWVVFAAGVKRTVNVVAVPAPDYHLAVSPHCWMTVAWVGRVSDAGSRPTIHAWIVSAATVQFTIAIVPTPGDHFALGPHCSVFGSCIGRVGRAGSCPTIGAWIVSAACVLLA